MSKPIPSSFPCEETHPHKDPRLQTKFIGNAFEFTKNSVESLYSSFLGLYYYNNFLISKKKNILKMLVKWRNRVPIEHTK